MKLTAEMENDSSSCLASISRRFLISTAKIIYKEKI